MPTLPTIGILFFLLVITSSTGCTMQTGVQKASPQIGDSVLSSTSSEPAGICYCLESVREDAFNVALQALVRGEYRAARVALAQHAAEGSALIISEAEAGRDLTNILSRYTGDVIPVDSMEGTDRAVLINLVLTLIDRLERNIAALGDQNAKLAVDLEKREEALKRLRELTLGKPEA